MTIELQTTGSYILNYLAVCDLLSKEQVYLAGIANSPLGDQSERAMAAVAAATIGIKLLELNSAHEKYMQRLQAAVKAPSDAQIAQSISLSEKLAKDIRAAVHATVVIGIVTDFVIGWTAFTSQ